MALSDWLLSVFRRRPRHEDGGQRRRGPALHVVILDGTMSSLERGRETNAGQTFKLLSEAGRTSNLTVYYEAGIQWRDWRSAYDVMTGKGINQQIRRAYGVLASRYHEGDRIILIGYSRGAFAVRSLAGIIGRIGLLRNTQATARNVELAYRYYRLGRDNPHVQKFRELYCYPQTKIDAIGVWDTVKALGLKWPIVSRFVPEAQSFHDHNIGPHVARGFHALAMDETRAAYEPELWDTRGAEASHVEQVWFKGTHGDIGGQLGGHDAARPLANIPLVWMLERLEEAGMHLPEGWRIRFPQDPDAPSVGNWGGWGKIFIRRRRRIIGLDPSERVHETAKGGQ